RRTVCRPDRNGNLQPYYEYRDTAMVRSSPIRPEWIRVLRFVSDSDPLNRDVAYNTGHFLHQTTLFLGPTNFYWEVDGARYSTTLHEGDSNYIAPFCPHTFANPNSAEPSIIIAVTYGAAIARAREEFAVLGKDAISNLTI